MKYVEIKIILPCSLGLYCIHFHNGNFFMAIAFGVTLCAMSIASYLFIKGTPINREIKSVSLLNLIAKISGKNDIRTKQNNRSLFFIVFVFCFVLTGLLAKLFSPPEIANFIVLLGSLLFSLALSFFITQRETNKVDDIK